MELSEQAAKSFNPHPLYFRTGPPGIKLKECWVVPQSWCERHGKEKGLPPPNTKISNRSTDWHSIIRINCLQWLWNKSNKSFMNAKPAALHQGVRGVSSWNRTGRSARRSWTLGFLSPLGNPLLRARKKIIWQLLARRDKCRKDESAYCQKLVRPRCTDDKHESLLNKFERPVECRSTNSCPQSASNVQTYFASPAQATHFWISSLYHSIVNTNTCTLSLVKIY